eukprot:Hpha_TRINITY_DN12230_c0_g1::TRINITY_DN12230_c0_g1_i1::g.16937::m.16937
MRALVLLTLTAHLAAASPSKSLEELRGLLEAYNPVVWQHPDGLFYPVDVEDMMKRPGYPISLSRQCVDGKMYLMYSTTDTTTLKEAPSTGRLLAVAGRTAAGFSLTYFAFYHYDKGSRFVQTYDNYGDWEYIQVLLEWRTDTTSGVEYLAPASLRTEAHGNGWLLAWNDTNLLLEPGSGVDELGQVIQRPQVFAARDSHGFYPNPALELSVYPTDASQANRMCDESGIDISDIPDLIARGLCDYVTGAASGGIKTTFGIVPLLATNTATYGNNTTQRPTIEFTYIPTLPPSSPSYSPGEKVVYLEEAGETCVGTGSFPKFGPSYRWGNPVNAHGVPNAGSTNPRHKPVIWDTLSSATSTLPPVEGGCPIQMTGSQNGFLDSCECSEFTCDSPTSPWTTRNYRFCGNCPAYLNGAYHFSCPHCASAETELFFRCPNGWEACDVFAQVYSNCATSNTDGGLGYNFAFEGWTPGGCGPSFCLGFNETCQTPTTTAVTQPDETDIRFKMVFFHKQFAGGENIPIPVLATDPTMYFTFFVKEGHFCTNDKNETECLSGNSVCKYDEQRTGDTCYPELCPPVPRPPGQGQKPSSCCDIAPGVETASCTAEETDITSVCDFKLPIC